LNLDRVIAKLSIIPDSLMDREVRVGWFDSSRYPDGTPVAYVATIQEFGAPERSIPARSFIRPAVAKNKDRWVKELGAVAKQTLRGGDAETGLLMVGDAVAADLGITLSECDVKLSPITVLLREWRKSGRVITGSVVGEAAAAIKADPSIVDWSDSDPLNDTGYMLATISAQIGKRG
jgi:hypothetical protein